MMKGNGRFVGGGGLGTREPPLIELVERYLADNSNLSYINIDDMVDYFQAQYFRFARMQKKVFANQVRSAYFDYCKRNSNNNAKPRESNAQARMTTRPVEAENLVAEQSDSDVEEIDEDVPSYNPRADILNASLSSMYRNVSSIHKSKPTPPASASPKTPLNPVQAAFVAREPQIVVTPSSTTGNVQMDMDADGTNFPAGVSAPRQASDSDDDLEIIEEVQGRNLIQKGDPNVMEGPTNSGLHAQSGSSKIPSGLTVTVVAHDTNGRMADQLKDRVAGPTIREQEKVVKLPADRVSGGTVAHVVTKSSLSSLSSASARNRNAAGNSNAAFVQHRGVKRKNAEDKDISDELGPKKLKKEISVVSETGYRLADFAGSEKVVEEVCRLLMHLKHPEVYQAIGVTAPRGFLLHGPPGVGKTLLANAIAGELQLPMLKVTGTEFVSGISGESESNIRDLFNQAAAIAPCIIFIDEIDSITPKRETVQREMERRIVAQLLSCVDDLMNHEKGNQVLLIGATNRIESIDTALRRAGRFDKEICLGIPDEKSRCKILEVICRNIRLGANFDMSYLAKLTPGYVGADLQMLVREAAVQAVNKALMTASSKRITEPQSTVSEAVGNEEIIEPVVPLPDPDSIKVVESVSVSPEGATQANDAIINNPVTEEDTKTVDQKQIEQTVDGVEKEVPNSLPNDVENREVQIPDSSSELVGGSDKAVGGEGGEEAEKVVLAECNDTDEKMDVESADSSFPQITSVVSNAEKVTSAVDGEPSNNGNQGQSSANTNKDEAPVEANVQHNPENNGDYDIRDMADPKENDGEPELSAVLDEAPYLRWIKETAPLTADQLDSLFLAISDFEQALKHVQPSSKREGFATVPDTTWEDIGALEDIREELEVSILGPVKYSHAYESLGLMSPAGVLLCGPPGCGKTLLAKAVAHEAGINFISVKGPELLNMYVGESERAVRQCFLRAKNSSPCVIFFDEIDALCPRRSDAPESGSGSRIVNQLLTEMDGVEGRQGVFIMAATNRPDILDPAILRPGRLDKILFVDLPSAKDRLDILKTITKNGTKPTLSDDVDLKVIAEKECCDNYTGADLASLVREASIAAFKELVMDKSQNLASSGDLKVSMRHFEMALFKTKPSVTQEDRDKYAKMKVRYSSIRGR